MDHATDPLTAPEPAGGLATDARTAAPVRVLVVDDSLVARAVYARLIAAESDFALAGQASTAEEALEMLRVSGVDVILLDLQMPGMGGLDALPKMMALAPKARVLVVSSLTVEGGEHTLAALALGAADTLPKPEPGRYDSEYRAMLVDRIRALCPRRTQRPAPPPRMAARGAMRSARVLAIGASTGGILALRQFFESLPPRIGMPILVTQHLPVSFLPAFVGQIARFSGRPARLAENGALLAADEVLIAPGNAHLEVEARGEELVARLTKASAGTGCMPSVDPMLASLAQATGGKALAVVLTGMGRDGTEGAQSLVAAGGSVLVQDEASSAVWGMPGSIAGAGLASAILPPAELARRIRPYFAESLAPGRTAG
ncbi:chemotaxis-specific protein-glutamate methyltransferase CheB [Altererythrobacter lauratis]|uniref:protein-glutamate methylesterase n=1 Tax=Alteraurantiacibacter lauratis TaxID=2054627 RepID=A0ABV7EBS8_9SPHN